MSMRIEGGAVPAEVGSASTSYRGGRVTVEEHGPAMPPQERSWSEIVEATTRMLAQPSSAAAGHGRDSRSALAEMTGLLKLQSEVCRYQLRIELASKACESFTASLRKLQQQQ